MRTDLELHHATALRRAATSLAARTRVERAGELSLTQVAVLGQIATHGPVTPHEIGAQLRMSPQSLTRPLARLERAGLVERMPDPTDGRGALLQSTAAGIGALQAEMAPRDRWLASALAEVCTEQERALLDRAAELMQRLVEHGGRVAPHEP